LGVLPGAALCLGYEESLTKKASFQVHCGFEPDLHFAQEVV
jgi:hypothetical protein